MKLKKILAVVAAAAMAATLSLPVFAATPGETAQSAAWTLIGMTQNPDMKVEDAEVKMETITSSLQEPTTSVSSEMMSAALSFFDRMESDQEDNINTTSVTVDEVDVTCRSRVNDPVTINSVKVDASTGKVTLDAEATTGNDSFGYAITVELPADTNVTSYKIAMLGDNAQTIDAVAPVKGYEEGGVMHKFVTFWVPHFTTYELTAYTTTGASGEGSGNESGNENDSSSNNTTTNNNNTQTVTSKQNASTQNTSAATSSVEAENPIKATGSDMNRTVFVVVALAVAAACGMGVVSKKSRKSE